MPRLEEIVEGGIPRVAGALTEKETVENESGDSLAVKMATYDVAKKLGEELYIKYRKAFELLKDK